MIDPLIAYAFGKKYTDQEVTRIVNRETDSDAMSRQAAVDANDVDKVNLKIRLDDDYNEISDKIGNLSDVVNQYICVFDKKYKDLCPKDGNGVVTDWILGINQALTDSTSQGKAVLLPYGTVNISNSINLSTKHRLVGFGKLHTVIKTTGAFPAVVFNGNATTGVYYCELSNLALVGNSVGTIGLSYNYARETFVENVRIEEFQKGVTATQSWSNAIKSSEIISNSDTNVELGAQSNDFNLNDVQLDKAGNYGARITADSQNINFIGCVAQSCGKDGVLVEAGRAINFFGGYFENNNTSSTAGSGDIRVTGTTLTVLGLTLVGVELWTKTVTAGLILDRVQGVSVIGGSQNLVGGGTTQYSIQTSANTTNVFVAGLYKDSNFNDIGNAITANTSPVFRYNGGVKKHTPLWYLDTLDATTSAEFQQYIAGVLKSSLKTDNSGNFYFLHANASNTMETVFRVNTSNRMIIEKIVDFNKVVSANRVLETGATAVRPPSPVVGQEFYDTTLNKYIIYTSGGWRDAMGTVV